MGSLGSGDWLSAVGVASGAGSAADAVAAGMMGEGDRSGGSAWFIEKAGMVSDLGRSIGQVMNEDAEEDEEWEDEHGGHCGPHGGRCQARRADGLPKEPLPPWPRNWIAAQIESNGTVQMLHAGNTDEAEKEVDEEDHGACLSVWTAHSPRFRCT